MSELDDSGLAPKVFFVNPDPHAVDRPFLETAFFLGYETYVVTGSSPREWRERVDVILDTFPEVLLFFTIPVALFDDDWDGYLEGLQERSGARLRVGVLHDRGLPDEEDRLRRRLLLDLGISGGCIALSPSVRRNHQVILDVLAANQAGGRRKRIRVLCHRANGVNFERDGGFFDAVLIDLSINHFSARFDQGDPQWELGAKIPRVQLRWGGKLLLVHALVGLKRMVDNRAVYVFLFHPETDRPGLDDLVRARINALIFEQIQSRTMALLEDRFRLRI